MSPLLPLFLPSANQGTDSGEDRDCWVLNPALGIEPGGPGERMLRFLGRLMGVCLLRGDVLPLNLSRVFWKGLLDDPLELEDLQAVDIAAAHTVEQLRDLEEAMIDEELYEECFETLCFETEDSAHQKCPLIPGGGARHVSFHDAPHFAELLLEFRLAESKRQLAVVRAGLTEVVDIGSLYLWAGRTLEERVVGVSKVDVEQLKRHTTIEGYRQDSEMVARFWRVLEKFTQKDLQSFLRFTWGRSRLPKDGCSTWANGFKLTKSNNAAGLPQAHTCFFQLDLPEYESDEKMEERLLFAVNNCVSLGIA